jgi:hypothetical protein
MKKELLFQSLFLCLVVAALSLTTVDCEANDLVADQRVLETRACPVIGADLEHYDGPVAFGQSRWPYFHEHWQLGNTWYDYQHNATQGKQITIGEGGIAHICWMKGYDSAQAVRHAVYNCFLDGEVSGPAPVDNTARSGYCTIAVLNSDAVYANAAVVSFHQDPGSGLGSTVSPDYGPCWMAFLPFGHPYDDDAPIWPHIAIDNSNKVHVISTRQNGGTNCYDATVDFASWETPAWIVVPTSSASISPTVVASQFDDQVALLTHDHLPLHPDESGLIFAQMNNEVWVHIAEDGDFTDWAQVSSFNMTDMADPETTEHPLPGHVYGYCDIDGVFDSDGNLHVAYTTRPYWRDATQIDGEWADTTYFERWARTGQVWHAMIAAVDEEVEFSHIAGYVGNNNEDDADFASYFDGDPGGWGSLNDRPSLAVDPVDNTLYCMWRNFTSLSDTSAIGMSSADLWIRSSCDYGMTWGPAVNITDSHTPVCVAGECASEAWGTMAEIVYDDMLHLEFVEDLDAGGIVQDEGAATDNPVWYLQVPIGDVPCGDAWNMDAHATRLAGTAWNWAALEDGTYEITDFMHLLNEGAETLTLDSIELLYFENMPQIIVTQDNGNLGDAVEPYQVGIYQYVWNAVISDDEYDAVVRFHTSGGSVDFTLANRNPLDLETAQSMLWWDDVPSTGDRTPQTITLAQNYPNPFNPTTTIEYTLAAPSTVQLEIYNTLGEIVAQPVDGTRAAGAHSVVFDAGDLASGVYLYRLTAGSNSVTQKMVLAR